MLAHEEEKRRSLRDSDIPWLDMVCEVTFHGLAEMQEETRGDIHPDSRRPRWRVSLWLRCFGLGFAATTESFEEDLLCL